MSSSEFAIPLALLTTTAFNTGLIVEKRALGTMPPLQINKAGRTIVSLVTTPAWLAGLSLMLTGMALQVIVLAIEPISVVQPILASGVALTLVLSRLVLREKLGGAENWCVAIMAGSLVLLALSQDAASNHVTRGAEPLAMVGVVVPALAFGVLAASWPWRHGGGQGRPGGTAMLAGVGVGLLYGVSALASKGLSSVVGGGHAPAHLVIGLLSSPYLYLLFGCSAIAMLLYQAALQACRASVLIPVSNVVSSGFFVIVGTWLFHEQLPASPVKLGLRLAGIAAAGVVLVILGIQSRGTEMVGTDTELIGMETELAGLAAGLADTDSTQGQSAGTLAMAARASGPLPVVSRRTGQQPVLDRITGPLPLAVLRRTAPQPVLDRYSGPQPAALDQTGPQPATGRVTGPQLVGAPVTALVQMPDSSPAPVTGPQSALGTSPAPVTGPQSALGTSPAPVTSPQRPLGTDPADDPEPGQPVSRGQGRLSRPQPAIVRSTGSQATVSVSTDIQLTDIQLTDSPPMAGQPTGSQTWLSQAASSLLRGGRHRGKHEKSRTGKTGALSSD
jgi:uncharacterized membrane protein